MTKTSQVLVKQLKPVSLKTIIFSASLAVIPFVSSSAFASNFGCEALLCFAGGKNVAECQPTIKKVLRDLSKGRGFPHCSLVSGTSINGQSLNDQQELKDAITVKHYTSRQRKRICQDGVTAGRRTLGGYSCKTIEINVKPQYAADEKHVKQFYNY